MSNSITVTLYLGTDPTIVEKIQKAADKANQTRNEWMKEAIEEKLRKGAWNDLSSLFEFGPN